MTGSKRDCHASQTVAAIAAVLFLIVWSAFVVYLAERGGIL